MTAFDNSQIRNTEIWTPFQTYGFYNEIQETERAVIFGLYSNSFRNNDAYIQGSYDIELFNIIAEHNSKLAELDVDAQNLAMSIATKQYIAYIERDIHTEKMVTKQRSIEADDIEWDAKFAALAADQAALGTLRIKITAETKRINAKIEELKAYIEIEIANLELVNIEIAEKNITKARKDLELASKELELAKQAVALLVIANEITRVQLEIVEAAIEATEIDLKVARTKVDIAQINTQIAKLGFAEYELEMAKAKTKAEQADLETYASRVLLAKAQTDIVNKDIEDAYDTAIDYAAIQTAKISGSAVKQANRLQAILNQTEQRLFNLKDREVMLALERTLVSLGNTTQSLLDADRMMESDARANAAWTSASAAIQAANIMAIATVGSELTHLIKKA